MKTLVLDFFGLESRTLLVDDELFTRIMYRDKPVLEIDGGRFIYRAELASVVIFSKIDTIRLVSTDSVHATLDPSHANDGAGGLLYPGPNDKVGD